MPAAILDPFGERRPPKLAQTVSAFGARFDLRSDAPELLALAREAYGGLAVQRLGGRAPRCTVELRLVDAGIDAPALDEPPPLRTQGGAGVLCGIVDAANFVMVQPRARQALVVLSRGMLERHRYHARYELLEFALFTLACRALGRMPLHAACVGTAGGGLLLVGESGAGKSTLALHAMFEGLELLTEDAAFVHPQTLVATGVPNFVHLRPQALEWIDQPELVRALQAGPMIRRRSGVLKFELDLRQPGWRPARAAMPLVGGVLVSADSAPAGPALLRPLSPSAWRRQLEASQPYARGFAGWAAFAGRLAGLPAYRLRRGAHPREGAAALEALLHGVATPSGVSGTAWR